MIREKRKSVKEKNVCFSLNSYCSEDGKVSYFDIVKDNNLEYQPDIRTVQCEQKETIEKYILENCSCLERSVIKGHELGLKDVEIAKALQLDVKKIYNANYRIQKKMSRLKLFD